MGRRHQTGLLRTSPAAWIALLCALALFALGLALPAGIDWRLVFRPAARAMLTGGSPYAVPGFYNPPWALLPLLPLALLPDPLDHAVGFALGAAVFAFVVYRLRGTPIAAGLVLLSPSALQCLYNGNIDWMALLGFVLPPRWGLFLLAVKPQIGAALALYWLVEAWREGRLRAVWRLLWPVAAAAALALLIFGFWPAAWRETGAMRWNASLWPASLPIGLWMLAAALRRREVRLAMAATPFLSPYVLLGSWAGVLVAAVGATGELAAIVVGQWVLVALVALGVS